MSELRDYAELDEEEKVMLVSSSLGFIRSVTEVWGPEKGMELWETISGTISVDLKGDLFFGMITGKYSLRGVTFTNLDPIAMSNNFINMIKAVRTATGWGLKDAKDFCDAVKAGEVKTVEVSGKAREVLLTTLRGYGIEAR
jgi:hypothetical protein